MTAFVRWRPGRSDRLVREALALGLLLLLCAAAHRWIGSNAGLHGFKLEPAFARLDAGAFGKIRREGDALVVRSASNKPAVAMLDEVTLEPDKRYLLVLQVGGGLGYRFEALDENAKPALRLRLPPRAGSEERLFVLEAANLPERLRFRIVNKWPEELRVERVELYRLSGAYRLAGLAPWLAALLLLALFGGRHRRRLAAYFASPDRAGDRFFVAAVFAACLLIFSLAPVQQIADSKYITVVSHSLLTSGTLSVPAAFAATTDQENPYHLRQIDGRYYHFFPNAPAVLNAPFVAAYRAAGVVPMTPDGMFFRHHEARILRTISALVAAALCAVLFLLGRLWLPPGAALALVAVFALGTQIFSSISRPFWTHGWAVLLLAAALYLLLSPSWNRRAVAYVASASLLSWSYFCRPTMALSVVAATLIVAVEQRRRLPVFAGVGLVWLALFVLQSMASYGEPLPPYMFSWHIESGHLGARFLDPGYLDGVLGTLISPGRGLLVFVPFVPCVLWIAVRRRRWLPSPLLAALAFAVFVAHWQVLSLLSTWWGGQSYGPRLFSDIVPWLFLLSAMALHAFREATRSGDVRWPKLKAAGIALTVAAALFINVRGATAPETWRWRSFEVPPRWLVEGGEPRFQPAGMWNWRYPQFMAGLIEKEQSRPRPD